MNRLLKRILLIFGILIFTFFVLATVVGFFFEDAIGRQVVKALNSQLRNEIRVERASLSLIRGFPRASLTLEGLEVDGADDRRLLDAERLSFRIGLLSLFRSTTEIHSIVIRNGNLNIRMDAAGKGNYEIFESSDTETSSDEQALKIDLREARLIQVGIEYEDKSSKLHVLGHVRDAVFSGAFSTRQFDLLSSASIDLDYLESNGDFFLPGQAIHYEAGIAVDLDEERYEIRQLDLHVGENMFNLNGYLDQEPGFMNIDLQANAQKASLEGVLALFPRSYLGSLENIQSKGDFFVDATIAGRYNKRSNPAVDVRFGLENGQISSKQGGQALKEVSFEGRYSNGAQQTARSSWLDIPNFKGFFQRQYVEMQLRVDDFSRPNIDFSLNGALPMDALYGFLENPSISAADGRIEFDKLRLKGTYKDMQSPARAANVDLSGRIVFDKVSLEINKELISFPSGALSLSAREIRLSELRFEAPGTVMQMNATCSSPLPLLFADSLNSQRAELSFDAALRAERLDLNRLLQVFNNVPETGNVTSTTIDSIQTAQTSLIARRASFLKGQFTAEIDHFEYGEIEASAFKGNLLLNNNQLSIQGDVSAMRGKFKLDGKLYLDEEPQLQAHLIAEQVDVGEFFRQTENFGQDMLTEEHLSGTLNAKIAISAFFNEQGVLLEDKLHVLVGMGIENGELKDFELLQEFSTYVNVRDLRNIKFSNLENYLEISRGVLHIPVMFIQSNALNLTISGRHNFENEFTYFVKVNAGQVLANRMKKHDPSLQPVEARQRGVFNLYYKIYGDLENYDFASSRKEIKEAFERSERDKTVLRAQLEREFGFIQLISEPPAWLDVNEYGYEGPDGTVEFLDEIIQDQ